MRTTHLRAQCGCSPRRNVLGRQPCPWTTIRLLKQFTLDDRATGLQSSKRFVRDAGSMRASKIIDVQKYIITDRVELKASLQREKAETAFFVHTMHDASYAIRTVRLGRENAGHQNAREMVIHLTAKRTAGVVEGKQIDAFAATLQGPDESQKITVASAQQNVIDVVGLEQGINREIQVRISFGRNCAVLVIVPLDFLQNQMKALAV
jgi:hypothetical protein